MRFLKVIFSTIIVLLGVVFIIENLEVLKQPVTLHLDLYLTQLQSPPIHLWVLVIFFFFLGVFTASLYGIYEVIVQRQTIRRLRHNLEILAQELKQAGVRAEASAAAPASTGASPTE
ncbi:MAG: LapA family protein [Deltaproteobacteria bacterium]|nr:LapA family protein [Deltaproteobacteria bacterium]